MKIGIGNDQAAVEMKFEIVKYLEESGYEVVNFGTDTNDSCDYPVYGEKVARAVANGEVDRGILICGTGVGISLAANKVKGIRAAVCSESVTARFSRLHNDANILAFGARIVGVETDRAKELMTRLYRPFLLNNLRVIFTDIPSAEMIKYAANSMLATRISFMNDIANLCELVGADINMVRLGIGSDTRIGTKFLYPGCGYGGSCFPKDGKALVKTAEKHGYDMKVLRAVEAVNENQKSVVFKKLEKAFDGNLAGKVIALWGLAFKPETDDMREAASLVTIDLLRKAGCTVKVYDPVAMQECRRRLGDAVTYAKDMYDAVDGADALLVLTEWKMFRLPSWPLLKETMRRRLVIDGRNIYVPSELLGMGFEYKGIGIE